MRRNQAELVPYSARFTIDADESGSSSDEEDFGKVKSGQPHAEFKFLAG